MTIKTIKKSIGINAPKEKVWDVLTNDKLTRLWYAEFSEGTYADTDWKVGSKAMFIDKSKSGMLGKVIANQANEFLSIEFEGAVKDGKAEYESAEAQAVKGTRETYQLAEKGGVTQLSIESDMGEEYFETMSASWDKALQKIKTLAETK